MPVDIQILDEDLKGFSVEARNHLKKATKDYATELIEEANRIEAGRNTTAGPPEVTRGMVNDAKFLFRKGLGASNISMKIKVCRVFSAVLSLVVGIMYDKTKLVDAGYMFIFILLVAATIFLVTISTLKE